jgi:hypothetical protein
VASLELSNCTVAFNAATGSAFDLGGGIHDEGTMTLRSCTVAGNRARIGGGLQTAGADLGNTIVAGNSDTVGNPDVSGTVVSSDYNLIGRPDGLLISGLTTHNLVGQEPALGPLLDYGGSTPTMALRAGSPAIDRGKSFGRTVDQRGGGRFDDPDIDNAAGGDGSDIGAYEIPELRLGSIERLGNDARLSFFTALDRTYRIEERVDWGAGPWVTAVANLSGNGGLQFTVLTNALGLRQRFFRLRRE